MQRCVHAAMERVTLSAQNWPLLESQRFNADSASIVDTLAVG
ncbi:hypothetical protein SAMN05444158_7253 [Bradyrhizobium canariense]|uniref:Uncharacterized protein n=1 Tax=Bradyrhizobium canariense TaxID=255045 RepID=A0A1H2BJI3_9BRAD|nr:hypothetical protein SAMN05444158_7253 [Bradyrhizobium canariense]